MPQREETNRYFNNFQFVKDNVEEVKGVDKGVVIRGRAIFNKTPLHHYEYFEL